MKKRVIEFILLTVFAVLFLSGCKKNVGTPEDNPVVEEDEESVEPAKDYLYGYSCADLQRSVLYGFERCYRGSGRTKQRAVYCA